MLHNVFKFTMSSRPSPSVTEPTAVRIPLNGTRSFLGQLFSWLPSWKPTSESLLEEAEKEVLKEVKSDYKNSYIPIAPDAVVRTFILKAEEPAEPERIPLVLIHGFGAGFLQFYKNLDHLHSRRKVLAFDMPGFGRSTRVPFTPEAQKAEEEFVDSIERWRRGVGVEKFILLGHSLGGFLACSYAMSYPSRVRHLILVDPWGLPASPSEDEFRQKYPRWAGILWRIVSNLNPFTPVRAAGPWGPDLVKRMRPDLSRTFGDSFMDYVYHCNTQKPTGEAAYFHMQHYFAWAKRPLLARMSTHLDSSVPVSVILGDRSWMRHGEISNNVNVADEVLKCRIWSYVDVHRVVDAGHHVHADQPEAFNALVNGICYLVDAGQDLDESKIPNPVNRNF